MEKIPTLFELSKRHQQPTLRWKSMEMKKPLIPKITSILTLKGRLNLVKTSCRLVNPIRQQGLNKISMNHYMLMKKKM